ncbi:hypothetical protein B9Q04_18350 [Candidatus Marsarchaeota G2 archaeon BE_D]|uniref:Uncharacterized protein n=1 Tax=Candidatus Marsarchaeota G2 archaeon BE_D TaxID=1978158 RepID=A0A2R6C531_9ARCH|nr:MAG: hypothetical protein B9Q04_18350 [Candidatus Marsarchaeota G2 archaeon BE_D]
MVDKAVTSVLLKPGIIGIKVKIALPNMYTPQVVFKQVDQSLLNNLKKQLEEEKPQESVEEQARSVASEQTVEQKLLQQNGKVSEQ